MGRLEEMHKRRDQPGGFAGFLQAFDDVMMIIYESPMGRAEAAKGGTPGDVVGRVMKTFGDRQRQVQQEKHDL